MTYDEAQDWINHIPRFAKKHDPDTLTAYLDALGAPDRSESLVIHVAGTNGKGSTCCYLSHCLREAGWSTAVFLSPHLVTMRERMRYNGEMISEEDFVRIHERVMALPKETGLTPPTFFEHLFLMMEIWAAEKHPDALILETGLGGRLDATNSVRKKDLCVLTRIGMDHMQILGDTIEKIAGEKAGILRPGVPAVCLDAPKEAREVFEKRAKELSLPLYVLHTDGITAKPTGDGSIDFSYDFSYDKPNPGVPAKLTPSPVHAKLASPALYQGENAALAALAVQALRDLGHSIPDEAISAGLSATRWEGRMEEVEPGFYVDGAHNGDGFRAFLESASPLSKNRHTLLLYAAMRDKDYRTELSELAASKVADWVVFVPLATSRAEDPKVLREAAAGILNCPITVLSGDEGTKEAVRIARRYLQKYPNALVLAAGSLYLVGEIKEEIAP